MVYGRTARKPARIWHAVPPGLVGGPILGDVTGDAVMAREHARVVLGSAGRTDDDGAIAGALVALASIARDEGRLADAVAFLAAAVERSEPFIDSSPALASRVALVGALCAAGDFDEADRAVVEVDRAVRRAGSASWRPAGPVCAARVAFARGRLELAATEAGRGLRMTKMPETSAFARTAHALLELVALQRGDLDAPAGLESASSGADRLGLVNDEWIAVRRAHARGDRETLLRLPTRGTDGPSRFARLIVEHPPAAPLLARAALADSQPDRAREITLWSEVLAGLNRSLPGVVAGARHARGVLDGDPDVVAGAAASQRGPWSRGLAHEDAGELLLAGDPAAARAQLDEALAAYGEAGATRDAARVRSTLDDLVVRPRRARARRPRWGWESLTETELQVANAVSDALTNAGIGDRMFLSRHTVDFHLRHIYRKLGIASRVELTRFVVERGGNAAA